MKCPECSANHKYSSGLICSCGYSFTFNPKSTQLPAMRDNRLLNTIRRVSRDGTAVFTMNQLYSAYIDSLPSYKTVAIVIAVFFIVLGCVALTLSPVGLLVIVLGIVLALFSFQEATVPRRQFDDGIRLWISQGRKIEGLLEEPTLNVAPENWPESDIYDYGVERILIVQRPILVDLFVKNNQHAEQRMLVISESGYPEYLQDRTNKLLAERSDLPIYLLHDADEQGVGMAERIRNSAWFVSAGNSMIDLGFFASDFENLKRTRKYRDGTKTFELPVDALRMGSLTLALSQCFANQSTIAKELHREQTNEMAAGSSFG